jgi:hypothetical protein
MANALSVAGAFQIEKTERMPCSLWGGLLHDVIAPFTFLISLFAGGVSIYETNNNGRG